MVRATKDSPNAARYLPDHFLATSNHTLSSSVRHHFVPQGFLRGFGTEENPAMVWVYDKTPGIAPRLKSVRSIAWLPSYYATEREDGSIDSDTVERALAQTVDSESPGLIRGIQALPNRIVKLSDDQRETLAMFVGLSLARVPSFRDGINEIYTRIAQIGLARFLESNPADAKMAAMLGGVRAEAKPWVSLEAMVKTAEGVAESLLKKNWQFYIPSRDVPFLTTDNPVHFSGGAAGLSTLGPAHPGAEVVMNLRHDLALVCTFKSGYPNGQTFQLNPSETRKFNRGVVRAARQRVFGNRYSIGIDSFVKKYVGEEQRLIGC